VALLSLRKCNLFALVFLLPHVHPASGAETYTNVEKRYSVVVSSPWSTATIADPTADFFVRCDPVVCGPTVLLSFGAIFDSTFKNAKLADLLRHVNGTSITQTVRSSPMVAKVVLIREGPVHIGTQEGYEVLSQITVQDGRTRMRHTFIAFRGGYVYTINLSSPPDSHERALVASKAILSSFKLN
jgi:hypothetical protein